MPDLETAIKTATLAPEPISSAVGDRMRPLVAAGKDLRPYLTYEITDDEPIDTLADGPSDYAAAEFEIGIIADTYAQVLSLSKAIKNQLHDNGQTVESIEFAPITYQGKDDRQFIPAGESKPVYLRIQSYRVLYREAPSP